MRRMQLGLQLGYWGAGPPVDVPELIVEAERCGFAAVFAAESWGSDAFTPLAWWGARTERVLLGTSVAVYWRCPKHQCHSVGSGRFS